MRAIKKALLIAMVPATLAAQSQNHEEHNGRNGAAVALTVRAAQSSGAIVIDGKASEAAWSAAEAVQNFIQLRPRAGNPSTEKTEARVLYDAEALYIAIRAFDAAPDSIIAQLARRDQEVLSDWVHVSIDSYHDRRTAFVFGVNAAGVKSDNRLTDDSRSDLTWDAVWDAAVSRDEQGWTAEFKIPFSQLRYNKVEAGNVWGINFRRLIARRDEMSYWAPVQPNSQALVSVFGELHGLPQLAPPQRIELVPYTVARLTREPGDITNPYYRDNKWFGSGGADLKFGVTPALTLNATINPDFGQVEADPSVVNLSAYETFFPERRPFFIEGAELFRTNGPQVFYSRRIGRSPQGFAPGARFVDMPPAATILGAAKLTGRTRSGWSIGVLQALTAEEEARYINATSAELTAKVEPLTSYTVGRIARDFRRGQSAVGALITAAHRQLDETGLQFLRENAFTMTIDARHRFGGGQYELASVFGNSLIQGDTAAIARVQRGAGHFFQRPDADHLDYDPLAESMSGTYAQASLAKVTGGNWRWNVGAQMTTPGYEINDVGFNTSSDRFNHNASVTYFQNKPGKRLRSWNASANQYSTFTTAFERVDVMNSVEVGAQFTNLWGGSVNVMRHLGGVTPDVLRGGPAITNPGSWMVHALANTDRRKKVSFNASVFLDYEVGTEGYVEQFNPSVLVRPTPRLDLTLGPSFSRSRDVSQWVSTRTVNGEARYVVGTVDQKTLGLTTRFNYTFAPTLSLQVYAQPFVGAGEYSGFKEVRRPNADNFDDQFHLFAPSELRTTTNANGSRSHAVDLNRDGRADYTFGDPSFNIKNLRSTSVLRWEYRPGSALFVVWSHDRSGFNPEGSFDLSRDVQRLRDVTGRNVLQLKLTYWLGL